MTVHTLIGTKKLIANRLAKTFMPPPQLFEIVHASKICKMIFRSKCAKSQIKIYVEFDRFTANLSSQT